MLCAHTPRRDPDRVFEYLAGDDDTLSGEELVSGVSRRASPPTACYIYALLHMTCIDDYVID